jgi:hypothetical protein
VRLDPNVAEQTHDEARAEMVARLRRNSRFVSPIKRAASIPLTCDLDFARFIRRRNLILQQIVRHIAEHLVEPTESARNIHDLRCRESVRVDQHRLQPGHSNSAVRPGPGPTGRRMNLNVPSRSSFATTPVVARPVTWRVAP